ncbi:MAG: hypothetical protein KKH94_11460 [Candidatus Omnitrophica bacterium]|nr:hypothetical protein [Candidatus Omnitrophota bacterium]
MVRKIIVYNFWERLFLKVRAWYAKRKFKEAQKGLERLRKVFEETSYTAEEWAEGFKKLGKLGADLK